MLAPLAQLFVVAQMVKLVALTPLLWLVSVATALMAKVLRIAMRSVFSFFIVHFQVEN